MQKLTLVTAMSAVFATTLLPAFAADELDDVIVTASRTAQPVDTAIASTTIITRAEIERTQSRNLMDLMSGLPGISFANSGGEGKATSMFMRGTNADHVLVLVDGVRMGSATAGGFSWADMPLPLIERIEIVRGPSSSLYGSDAIGGVIQIFTRKGATDGFTPHASLGGGSYNSVNGAAGFSGGNGNMWTSGELAANSTSGFNAYNGGSIYSPYEGDNDGYRNYSGSLRGGAKLGDWGQAGVNLMRAQGKVDFDGGYVNQSETVQQALGANLKINPSKIWNLELAAGQSRDDNDSFKDGTFKSRFNTQRDTALLQGTVNLNTDHALILASDYLHDQVNGTTTYAADSRYNTGLMAEWLGNFGNLDTQVSLRNDNNEQFGNHGTWKAGAGYVITSNLRITANAGTAFKAPTFNELYYPGYGNNALLPEESTSYELGLNGSINGMNWRTTIFQNDVTNLINSVQVAPFIYQAANIDKANISGLEASLGGRIEQTDLRASYTYLDPRIVGGLNDGNILPRRAQNVARFDIDQAIGQFSVGTTLNVSSGRYEDVANTIRMGGYTTVDLRGEYRVSRDWRVQANIVNLFNKDYETAYQYNQTGLAGYLTLRYGM
jgi:vitamin B12 transporter